MVDLHAEGMPLEYTLIAPIVGQDKARALITADPLPGPAAAAHVAKRLNSMAQRRNAHTALESLAQKVSAAQDFADVRPEVESALLAMLNRSARVEPKGWKELLGEAVNRLQANVERDGGLRGVSSGLDALDEFTGGFLGGQLIVIGGATGGGKTALGVQFAMAAGTVKNPAVIYSLEMSDEDLIDRIIAGEARVPLSAIRHHPLNDEQMQSVARAVARLANDSRLIIDDQSDTNILALRSSARRHAARNTLALILVDYCQLVAGTGRFEGSNREREVAEISRNLKQMAKELDVPVILLSQLNDDGRLRESRAIGQDADIVLKINPVQGDGNEQKRVLEIAKHRNGPRGMIRLEFRAETTSFTEAL
jgi:replicative DNA helicase